MRLTTIEQQTILKIAKQIYGDDVHIYLFGSRTDKSKRGGDIDLLVRTISEKKKGLSERLRMQTRLKIALGDQKIDIIGDYEEVPFMSEILAKGILLQ